MTTKAAQEAKKEEVFNKFPNDSLKLTLANKCNFSVESKNYNSLIEFLNHKNGNSRDRSKKSIPEYSKENSLYIELGLTELLKQIKWIRDAVLSTKNDILVYTNIKDEDWGIRLASNDPLSHLKSNWKGKNGFGEILMKVRSNFQQNPDLCLNVPMEKTFNSNHKISFDWRIVSENVREKFTYLWRADSPFSQHHPTKFQMNGQTFNCSEQYYMYMKAVTFKDERVKNEIMKTDNPVKQKSLARGIFNFDSKYWDSISENIVYEANIAKFGQNSRLLKLLLMTEGTTLVEASPKDQRWGVGLEAHDANIFRRETWKGTNLLGCTLTRVRQHFIDSKINSDYNLHELILPDCYFGFSRSSSPFHYTHMTMFKVDGVAYSSLNHYLVHQTAEIFNDVKSISEIKSCMDNTRLDKLYFAIKNFDNFIYEKNLRKLLLIGNYNKFMQNKNLLAQLLDTAGCVLVFQASDILGNGVSTEESDHITNDINWTNRNLLGYCLTYIRDEYLRTNGNFSIGSDFDDSMYKRIPAVSYYNSMNYRKKTEANRMFINDRNMNNENKNRFNQKNTDSRFSIGRGKRQTSGEYPKNINSKLTKDESSMKNQQNNNYADSNIDYYANKNNTTSHFVETINSSNMSNDNWNKDIQSKDIKTRHNKIDPFCETENVFDKDISEQHMEIDSEKIVNALSYQKENINAPFDSEMHNNNNTPIANAFKNNDSSLTADYDESKNKTQQINEQTVSLQDHNTMQNLNFYTSCKSISNNQYIDNTQTELKNINNHVPTGDHETFRNLSIETKKEINMDHLSDLTSLVNTNVTIDPTTDASLSHESKKHLTNEDKEAFLTTKEDINKDYTNIDKDTISFDKFSKFSLTIPYPIQVREITFPTLNHYIYWRRAELHKCQDVQEEILSFKKSHLLDRFDKELKYRGHDNDDIWQAEAENIIFEANLEKFMKNEDLKSLLLKTKGMKIVYNDANSVIGWGKNKKGKNILGKVLEKIRDDLI